jgi:hypothetical protein
VDATPQPEQPPPLRRAATHRRTHPAARS